MRLTMVRKLLPRLMTTQWRTQARGGPTAVGWQCGDVREKEVRTGLAKRCLKIQSQTRCVLNLKQVLQPLGKAADRGNLVPGGRFVLHISELAMGWYFDFCLPTYSTTSREFCVASSGASLFIPSARPSSQWTT
mmetsp:Transcript_121643/g.389197  ORF Transcript_121643/g.389197 Transcript_121643/m.389197 type:complete len:134 (+) Transcript_121643:251-652(+)